MSNFASRQLTRAATRAACAGQDYVIVRLDDETSRRVVLVALGGDHMEHGRGDQVDVGSMDRIVAYYRVDDALPPQARAYITDGRNLPADVQKALPAFLASLDKPTVIDEPYQGWDDVDLALLAGDGPTLPALVPLLAAMAPVSDVATLPPVIAVTPATQVETVVLDGCALFGIVRRFAGQITARWAAPLFGAPRSLADRAARVLGTSTGVRLVPGVAPDEMLRAAAAYRWQHVCSGNVDPPESYGMYSAQEPDLADVAAAFGVQPVEAHLEGPQGMCAVLARPVIDEIISERFGAAPPRGHRAYRRSAFARPSWRRACGLPVGAALDPDDLESLQAAAESLGVDLDGTTDPQALCGLLADAMTRF